LCNNGKTKQVYNMMANEEKTDSSADTKKTLSKSGARLVQVFRSPREQGMYLYVDKKEGVLRVPEALLAKFGTPESAMLLMLTPDKKLARAKAANVLAAIQEKGFYLQLPPEQDMDMLMIRLNNPKLQTR